MSGLRSRHRRLWTMVALAVFAPGFSVAHADAPVATPAERDDAQDVIFLGDNRPIFLRLKLDTGGKGFRAGWLDAVKSLHAWLDRDGDGTVTKQEADRGGLAPMVRAATGNAAPLPTADLDSNPRDGKVSLDELAAVLRPALGPFRVQVNRLAAEKTDALFNHLDRDKDGTLTQAELATAVASLRRFDLDDDELIAPNELDPFSNPMAAQYEENNNRRGRFTAVAPVLEISHDDPSFRPVRTILRKYDIGDTTGAPGGDNRLSRGEFGIDPRDFNAADTDADGALDSEELRRFLAAAGPDIELTVTLPDGSQTPASIEVVGAGGKPLPPGVRLRRLSKSDVEIAVGEVDLEFHADSGSRDDDEARRLYEAQFKAADADNNQYLDKTEVKANSPLLAVFDLIDRDSDGKVYQKELTEYAERQSRTARSQIVLSAADQGRAIFALMDLNRDRRLGEREVRGTVPRVSSWDRNGDGKVGADEVPHHFQMTIGRGKVSYATPGLAAVVHGEDVPAAGSAAPAGPKWFLRMDRNHDGDVSRREFLGPRADFDRLDSDGDGLLGPDEAAAAKPKG
jgi:Ca2+-binding EF-hand superfamily protein